MFAKNPYHMATKQNIFLYPEFQFADKNPFTVLPEKYDWLPAVQLFSKIVHGNTFNERNLFM